MAALSKLLRKAYKMGDIPQPARVSPPEGADDQVVPHILGHTCASRLVQGGIDIRSVQMWLGHQPLSMTMRYAHSATNDLDGCVVVLEKPRGEQAAGSAESSLFSSPVTTPSAKRSRRMWALRRRRRQKRPAKALRPSSSDSLPLLP
ncbi:hypothetical protein ACVWWD_003435 [Mesorhizobium sp. URHB0026]